ASFSSRTGAEMDWLSLTLTTVLILVLYVIRLSRLRKTRIPRDAKLPPVPPATPLIGHAEYRREHFFATTAIEWAKSYGHTFRVKLGFTEIVIVNDYDAIERLFARDELLCRSKAWRLYGLSVGFENLMSTAIGFFQAGSAGVPTFMHWHMLHFALRADSLQAEVQAEIDRVIGPDRRPAWEDRRKMPLTMGVLWEMLRWKSITPLSVPRR
ncbi:hypothetical protein V5799_000341, partial [Amblyomma americanum]